MSYKKFDQADLEVIKNIIKDDERICRKYQRRIQS